MSLFKDLRALYLVIGLGGCFLLIILCEIMHWSMPVFWLVFLPFIFGCIYWLERKAKKRIDKMLIIMNTECRIQDFIDAYLPLYESCRAPWQRKNMCLILSSAYLNLGDTEKGMQYLEQFLQIDTKKVLVLSGNTTKEKLMVTWQAIYHNNMAVCYIRQGNLEKAEEMLEALKKNISLLDTKAQEVNREAFQKAYRLKKIIISIKREDYSEYSSMEKYINDIFQNAGSDLERVNYQAVLYDLYTGASELEKAKACKAYVIEHGGDSYYKKLLSNAI